MSLTGDFGNEIIVSTPPSGGSVLEYLHSPPTVSSNKTVVTSKATLDSTYLTTVAALGSHIPGGLAYQIHGSDASRDLVIDLAGESGDPLKYPFSIQKWRNVYLIGLHLRLEATAAGAIGQLQSSNEEGTNRHPRIPIGGAFRIDVTGDVFNEGVYIDASNQTSSVNTGIGLEMDYYIHRGTTAGGNVSVSAGSQTQVWTFQNTRCIGCEGGIGSARVVHSDYLQNQGSVTSDIRPAPRTVRYDGFIGRNGQEGIVGHAVPFNANAFAYNLQLSRFHSVINQDFEAPGYPFSGNVGHHMAISSNTAPTFDRVYYSRKGSNYPVFGTYRIVNNINNIITVSGENAISPVGIIHPEVHWVSDGSSEPNWNIIPDNIGYNLSTNHSGFYS